MKCSKKLPKASVVLTKYLEQNNEPQWTSFFVKYSAVINDQRGKSHFNWKVGNSNYHVLRSGCFPFIKYHCTKRPFENLETEDSLFYLLKIMNLGVPLLLYGIVAVFMISYKEIVQTSEGQVEIYFLLKEDKGASH
ncbi:uncharacterized protein C15orf61 homolog isoform X2 [Daktulosphaira vitifoliae]|uniref:uncharacterized protein C15orf61 homolog isoform X2 n=1 Tax=Daktulosphaira vitifoliae TaxID=58002 RepID=UPI0021AAD3FA|nr:uncharacterized protein C15orf61 homolog isoform X2 [Daktulosphaira vitifoliae]